MLLVDTEGHTQLANVFLGEEPPCVCLQFRERYMFISLSEMCVGKRVYSAKMMCGAELKHAKSSQHIKLFL